jgi:hypothetical protein
MKILHPLVPIQSNTLVSSRFLDSGLSFSNNTATGIPRIHKQQQHFNSTYAQNVGGGMPGGMMSFEPMAANEVIGSKF